MPAVQRVVASNVPVTASGMSADNAVTWTLGWDHGTGDLTAQVDGTGSGTVTVRLANGSTAAFDESILNGGPTVIAANVHPKFVTGNRSGAIGGFEVAASWQA